MERVLCEVNPTSSSLYPKACDDGRMEGRATPLTDLLLWYVGTNVMALHALKLALSVLPRLNNKPRCAAGGQPSGLSHPVGLHAPHGHR